MKYYEVNNAVDLMVQLTLKEGGVHIYAVAVKAGTSQKIDGENLGPRGVVREDTVEFDIRSIQAKARKKYQHLAKKAAVEVGAESDLGDRFEADFQAFVDADPTIIGSRGAWARSTADARLTYFYRNILPILKEALNSTSTLSKGRWDELSQELAEKVKKRIQALDHDLEETAVEGRTAHHVNLHLYAADVIYNLVRRNSPEGGYPELRFQDAPMDYSCVLVEQHKTLPDGVMANFAARLENLAAAEPRYVMGATLMFAAGLRPAEAAATLPSDTLFQEADSWAAIKVFNQEQSGLRTPRMKNPYSKRVVPMAAWGTAVLRRCVEALEASDDPWKEHPDQALTTAEGLSRWIRQQLCNCGLPMDNMASVLMETRGYTDAPVASRTTSYILRRNFAGCCRSICGLSDDLIDGFLGHRRIRSPIFRPDFTNLDALRDLANQLERMVFSPKFSRHPGVHPIVLSKGDTMELPQFPTFTFQNDGEEPLELKVTFQTNRLQR